MLTDIKDLFLESFQKKVAISLFTILGIWWFFTFFYLNHENAGANLLWASVYQLLAVWGAICGFIVAYRWGGTKSIMGKTIIFFSLGLVLQTFGQSVFSFYNLILHVDIPYPSMADIGFFGSIPFYIAGAIYLGRACGTGISLKSLGNKAFALLVPTAMLVFSYFFFLQDYQADFSVPLKIFLDFGYPLGQAIYVSIAILTYFLVKRMLGGVMRQRVLLILMALVVQYFADYNFLYQAQTGTWINGGYGDFVYALAYFLMAFGLIELGVIIGKIRENKI